MIWHKYPDEKPEGIGDYLTCAYLGEAVPDDPNTRCCDVQILGYFPEGCKVPYMMPSHYPGDTPQERAMNSIIHPEYWTPDEGFYEPNYEDADNPVYMSEGTVLYWAYLPNTPDEFIGSQNSYLASIHDSWRTGV